MIRAAFLALCLLLPVPAFAWKHPFNFQTVVDQARELSRRPYQKPPAKNVPDFLKNSSYDQWRDIRFKNEQTLWGQDKEPFKVRFFHLGFEYQDPVDVECVEGRKVRRFAFSPAMFNYGKNDFGGKVPADIGFAGFRLHYPINKPDYADEVAVFLGASYFRAVAKDQGYGLSARGAAVDLASAGGEEFPAFKRFWLVKPRPGAKQMTLYALLDSPSLSGAYEYTITPGAQTRMRVNSVLFIRKKIEKLGVAPMTSMFLHGEDSPPRQEDFRPEVHDSDGLLIRTASGEWIWRPLSNPPQLQVNTFEVNTPKGFGLLQRDEDFDHYQDLEARFERRPSAWVVPLKDWGAGHVELVQIPSKSEYNDNANAFWVPRQPAEAGSVLKFSYDLLWCRAQDEHSPDGYVAATRLMRQAKDRVKFIVDFEGPALKAAGPEKKLTAVISINEGFRVLSSQVFKNEVTGGWRLVFVAGPDRNGPLKDALPNKRPALDVRAYLNEGPRPLTETWTYTHVF